MTPARSGLPNPRRSAFVLQCTSTASFIISRSTTRQGWIGLFFKKEPGRIFRSDHPKRPCSLIKHIEALISQEINDFTVNILVGQEGEFFHSHALVLTSMTIPFFVKRAAYRMASKTSSLVINGCFAAMLSGVPPVPSQSMINSTLIRVPLIQGLPPKISGSDMIFGKRFMTWLFYHKYTAMRTRNSKPNRPPSPPPPAAPAANTKPSPPHAPAASVRKPVLSATPAAWVS